MLWGEFPLECLSYVGGNLRGTARIEMKIKIKIEVKLDSGAVQAARVIVFQ
jgi:hypothetical protein